MDLAGSVLPARYVRGRMATVAVAVAVAVAVNEFIFKQPVRIGDLLSFFPHLTRFGRTAITVAVEVCAALSAERFGSIPQGDAGAADLCGDGR